MGKGEIARYEQFLLYPQCFQKACFTGASKGVIVWEWVKSVGVYFVEDFGQFTPVITAKAEPDIRNDAYMYAILWYVRKSNH